MGKIKLFDSDSEGRVLDLLRQHEKEPLDESQIASALDLRHGARKRLRKLLNNMVKSGAIVCLRGARYGLGSPADLVTGEIHLRRSGDGFVRPHDGGEEVLIPEDSLNTALPRDVVVARLTSAAGPGMRTGKVIRILKRSSRPIVGTLRATSNFYYVVPIDPVYNRDFYVPDPRGARVNDRVTIGFVSWANRHVNPEAKVLEVIGPENNPSLDTQVIIRNYGLPDRFPDAVLREADRAARLLHEPGARRDLRGLYVLTIDPATARDYDDAISLGTDREGRRELGVHIADVAHFVRPGTLLDREAVLRGNSVYFPDTVLPMLPEAISNGVCSLRPDEDRLAFSVFIAFDSAGAPVKADFCRSIIRSRLRLTYEQAFDVIRSSGSHNIGGQKPAAEAENPKSKIQNPPSSGIDARAVGLLRQCHALAQQLRARRFSQYALNLDMPEYEIFIGRNGMIDSIRQTVSDISHQLIEECMIAANEAVDRALSERGFEIIRRVHEPPSAAKIEALQLHLAGMGFRPGDLSKRRNISAFLESIAGHPFEQDAKLATLKSMKRAVYMTDPIGHYGLAKKYYTHFTSPIRRYPDLVVHRVLAAMLEGRGNPYRHGELCALSLSCSRTEQTADAAEKALIEIKKYRYLEQQILQRRPEIYEAVVVAVKNFGMFVELVSLQIQGLVHISSISSQFVRHDSRRGELNAGRARYSMGTRVKVMPARIDFDKRQVDFVLANGGSLRSTSERKGPTKWKGKPSR